MEQRLPPQAREFQENLEDQSPDSWAVHANISSLRLVPDIDSLNPCDILGDRKIGVPVR